MARPKTDPPDLLDPDARRRILAWVRERYPGRLSKPELRDLWEQCRDWHLANGKRRVSWEATFRNWLRKEMQFRGERAAQRRRETPQEPREGRQAQIVEIGPYLQRMAREMGER